MSHSQKYCRLVASCQFSWFVVTCKQFATNLSILSSYNKSAKVRLVATWSFTDLLQLVETTCSKLKASYGNQLATSLLTNSKPCECILISTCNKLLQDVNRLVTTCTFLALYSLISIFLISNPRHFKVPMQRNFTLTFYGLSVKIM